MRSFVHRQMYTLEAFGEYASKKQNALAPASLTVLRDGSKHGSAVCSQRFTRVAQSPAVDAHLSQPNIVDQQPNTP